MAKIEYEHNNSTRGRTIPITVKLDGKVVGEIRHVLKGTPGVNVREGWQYFSKGSTDGGDIFPTITECQRSLGW